MEILPFDSKRKDEIFHHALLVLKGGGIVSYLTESYYALGVIATDRLALEKLFRIKERPKDKPLPIITGDRRALMSVVKSIPRHAEGLMKKYWPGPLTLVFEARDTVPELLTGGTGKVAVRIPGQGIALEMARYVALPITATSANISGLSPAVDAFSVRNYFDDAIDMIIDCGKAPGGRPSTIIDVTVAPHRILRQGRIIVEEGDGT